MKNRINPFLRLAALASLIAITMVQSANAATGTWSGAFNGIWDPTATNWSGVSGTPWDSTNGPGNTATLNTASLAAVVSGPVFTNGITFSTSGALSGSTINLVGATPTITVAPSQTGTISSIIDGTAGLIKTGTGILTLANTINNSFSGGLTIKAGTVAIQTGFLINGLGTGTVTIGDAANTGAAATLVFASGNGYPGFGNALSVTGNGTTIIGVTGWNPAFSGGLTLANNLTIVSNNPGGSNLGFNGGVTGTGNITVSINNSSNNSYVNFGTAAVNNSGTLTFNNNAVTMGGTAGVAGTGTGTNKITGGVGSNVTAITQASNSNPLTIETNTLTVNSAATTLTASGTAQFTVSGNVTGTGNLILNTNNNTRGILLSGTAVNNTGTITNSGTGTAFTTISAGIGSSVTSVTNSSTSGLILSGTNTYSGGTSVTAGTLYFRSTNAKPASGTHAFSAGTTLGLGVATSGPFFTSTDIDNAFSGNMTGNLSNVTVTATTSVGIDTTQGDFTYAVSGSPTKGLAKLGANTLILPATNTYTGATTISAGTLQLGNGGTTGSLATSSTITNSGTFSVNRSNAVVQGTDFSGAAITGTGSFIQAGSGTTTLNAANTYSGGTTVSGGRLKLVNNKTGSSNFVTHAELEFNLTSSNQTLNGGSITGTGNLIKSGGSQLILGASGSGQTVALTGATSIIDVQGGVLRNDFGNSNWGSNKAGLTVAGGAIFDVWDGSATVDALNGAGTINKGWSGDKTITIGVNNGSGTFSGVILNNSNLGYGGSTGGNLLLVKQGNGTQILSGTNTYAGATTISAGTLQIGAGTDAGSISSSSSIVNNGSLVFNVGSGTRTSNAISGNGSLTQNSFGGSLTLAGANTYTGATLVSAGGLTVSGSGTLSGTTSLTVSSGGRFNYLPTTIGTILTLGSGSTLTLNNGSILGLSWDTTTASKITALGAATIGTGSGVALNLTGTFTSGQSYTILTAASGLDTGSYTFANLINNTAVVGKSATALTVTPTTATALTTAFWKGGLSGATSAWALSDGAASNWVAGVGGTATALVPGSGADVNISATSVTTAPTSTVLGADMSIRSLTIADTTNGLGLNADGSTLTIANVAGITMNASVPTSTIAAQVALGANQTWTNHSTNALNVSGVVSGAFGLTKAGNGTLAISGANTYTGATTINAGTVLLGNAAALGTTAGNTVIASGATLDLNGQTIAEPFGTITGTGVGGNGALINSSGIAASITGAMNGGTAFTVGGSGNISLPQVSGSGSAITKTGAGTLTLGGGSDNGYLALTIGNISGTVIFNKATTTGNHDIGGTSSIGSGSTLQLAGTGDYAFYGGVTLTVNSGGVLDLNGKNQNYDGNNGNLNLNGTGISSGGALINNNTGTASTITMGTGTVALQSATSIGGSGNITLAGVVSSTGALTKVGTGTLTLSSANTYNGTTTIKAGALALGASGTFASSPTIVVGDAASVPVTGAVLDITAKTSFGFGSGQTVKGIGTINIGAGKSVTVAGFLAPGNSIGTINETGNLILTGTLQTELGTAGATAAAGLSDRTAVSGDLTLTGSTLQLINNSGADGNGSAGAGAYRIATYGGTLTGTFGTITNPLSATLHEKVITGGGNVDLNLYRLATGSTSAVNLGKTRVGGSLAGSLTIANSATADGFSENLNASVGSNAGHVNSSSGTVSGVIPGASSSTINVGLNTATSGAKSGTVQVSYVSDGTGLNNYTTTANGSQIVGVTGDVYALASADFAQTAGATISGTGPAYTLDFGTGLSLNTLYAASFSIQNGVVVNSFIDTLTGAYGMTGAAEFAATAVDFSGLAAGAAPHAFNITFYTTSSGSYSGTFNFDGTSVQSGLDPVSVGDFSIALSAAAIPEPGAALLGSLGLLALLRRRR